MRRDDRAIKDIEGITGIIQECKVFRVAGSIDNIPYIVPMNFGYEFKEGSFKFYVHCAHEGKKLEIFKKNPTVAFEMDCGHLLTPAVLPCAYGYNYKSVMGMGTIKIVTETSLKIHMLQVLMKHQTGKDFSFTPSQAEAVTVCAIDVLEISGKECK